MKLLLLICKCIYKYFYLPIYLVIYYLCKVNIYLKIFACFICLYIDTILTGVAAVLVTSVRAWCRVSVSMLMLAESGH